jgi:phage terminase small subunit
MSDNNELNIPAYEKLTPRQKLFVTHYLKTFNATASAKEAGYAQPVMAGPRMIRESPSIRAAIKELMQDRGANLGIDTPWLLSELVEAAMNAKHDYEIAVSPKTGKPLVDPHTGKGIVKRNSAAHLKALELIAKVLGSFQADREQEAPASEYNARIEEARRRVLHLVKDEGTNG